MGFFPIYASNAIFGVKRRSATPQLLMPKIRGLKPTATITRSLRDERLHAEGHINRQAAERHSMVAPSFKMGANGGMKRSVAERHVMVAPSFKTGICGRMSKIVAERHLMVAPSFKTGIHGIMPIFVAERRLVGAHELCLRPQNIYKILFAKLGWHDVRGINAAERLLMIPPTRTRTNNKTTKNVAERRWENQLQLERGRSMSRTYTCLHYHCVFSTKNREKFLNPDLESRIWSYIGGIARENKMLPIRIGGFVEHLHLLLSIPPVLPLSKAMQLLKGGSSHWIKDTFPELRGFAWQDGYSAFTVSKSQLPEIDRYIQNQREHHRVKSFQEEYLAFLERHGIQYDARYLWD